MVEVIDFRTGISQTKKTFPKEDLGYILSDLEFSALNFIANYRGRRNHYLPLNRVLIEIAAALNVSTNIYVQEDFDYFLCEEPWELDTNHLFTKEVQIPPGYGIHIDVISSLAPELKRKEIISQAIDSYVQSFYDVINGLKENKDYINSLETALIRARETKDFEMMNTLNQIRQKSENQRLRFLPAGEKFDKYRVEIR